MNSILLRLAPALLALTLGAGFAAATDDADGSAPKATSPDCTMTILGVCGNKNHDCSIQSSNPTCTVPAPTDGEDDDSDAIPAWDDPNGDGCGCSY